LPVSEPVPATRSAEGGESSNEVRDGIDPEHSATAAAIPDSTADHDDEFVESANMPVESEWEIDSPRRGNASLSSDGEIAPTLAITSDIARTRRLRPLQQAMAGCVLGAAIGDAMGHPTEFMSMDAIRQRWGAQGVQGFELYWEDARGDRFAPYTDDTQMAEAVLRSLLASRESGEELDAAMQRMGRAFVGWARQPQGGHRAPGNACLSGCRALAAGAHWSQAGGASAGGCGSVMRAYPFGLVFRHDLQRAERWAVAHSALTHRDPIALAASAAMAVGVALALRDESPLQVASMMIAAAARYSPRTATMMSQALDEAQDGTPADHSLDRLRGWAAHEAIAAAVFLFVRHSDDPRAAILQGANSPGDSDSLATLAGALVGARCGVAQLPQDWLDEVERSSPLLELALAV
jgi:ADP-ribosylglycohydrolase